MTQLLELVAGWRGYAALALVCFLAGSLGTWRTMSWREQAHQAKTAVRTVQQIVYRDRITERVATTFEKKRAQDAGASRNRVEEVPVHVTLEIDREYPVPCGFVRVFNAATHGPIPDPASCPDDAPSGIALSEVGRAESENAGQYDAIAGQLRALQDWVHQQQVAGK
jgi:hypothetical protein